MKKILLFWFCMLLFPIFIVGVFNFYADPNYIFNNNSVINKYRAGFNEREIKINFLESRNQPTYDAVILGASRSTYLNTYLFTNEKVFNFSVSNMNSEEFLDFADYFKKYSTNKMKIYLFLDYIGMTTSQKSSFNETYLNVGGIEYLLSSLFSFSTTKRSSQNLLNSIKQTSGHRAYLSNLDVIKDDVDKEISKRITSEQSKLYYKNIVVDEHLEDNFDKYFDNLKLLSNRFGLENITVTTSPISLEYLIEIYSQDELFQLYLQWIKALCEIYDSVNFMTYSNDFTNNFQLNSWDGNHIYPESFKKSFLVLDIDNTKYTTVLTKQNVDKFIIELDAKRQDIVEKCCSNKLHSLKQLH